MECQVCEKDTEVLEHHVLYSDQGNRFSIGGGVSPKDMSKLEHLLLNPTEIVVRICMSCHNKIHDNDIDYFTELNPMFGDQEWIDFLSQLDKGYDIEWGIGKEVKYKLYNDKSGICQTVKSDGDICGRNLPCRYHGNGKQWKITLDNEPLE